MVSRFLMRLFLLAVIAASSLHIVKAQELYPYKPGTYGTYFNNYVRTIDLKSPETDTTGSSALPLQDALFTTQYYDGLGRPLQTVIREGSLVTGGSAKDFVNSSVYDQFGFETRKYLPYAFNTAGKFQINPFEQQKDFYDAQFASQGERFYYSKTEVDAPSSQVPMKSFAPGNSWVGSNRGVNYKYWFNSNNDSVRIWSVTDNAGGFGTYAIDTANAGYYPEGRLNKIIIIDEHGKQVIQFTDMEGRIILKKVQLTADVDAGTGKGYHGWLSTYYIYDDLDQLRCVVQPMGVELLVANGWSMTYSSGIILKEQCFRYEYDERQRMILKKVPGAGTVYMIYDERDRLVMMQDSMLRADQKWMYTLYDGFNRPATTGLITDNSNYNNPAYHRTQAASSSAYPNTGSYTDEILTKTFYDSYAWRSSEGNPLSATRNSSYDSYLLTASNTTYPYAETPAQTAQLVGMVTGSKVKVLGTNDYLFTVNFYDDKGRSIQAQATNITGGTDVANTQYSWSGQPLLSIAKHEKAASNSQTTIILTKPTYDDLGRQVKIEKRVSNSKVNSGAMPGSWTTLSENEYDALGQLKKKKLAPAYNSNAGLEAMNYEYNIRGWILGANRSYVKDTASTSNWFGFDLGYDKTVFTVNGGNQSYSAAQYNGNINGMLWRSTGDDQLRKYDFTYDAANRFLSANFNQYTNAGFNRSAGIDFSVGNMSYDANGNILSMKQRGLKIGSSITIDSLTYNYYSGSNRLLNVIDHANVTDTRLGDFRTSALHPDLGSKNNSTVDYTYDGNGSVVKDLNKDMLDYSGANGIEYNHLNLPKKITVKNNGSSNKGTIEYIYDAAGNKLKKVTTEGATVTTTLYMLGNYVNDDLQFIGTEEGRLRFRKTDSTLHYDYTLKDHLGNVRMVLTEEPKEDAYPVASLESASLTNEQTYYGGLTDGRVNKSTVSGYPNDTYTNPNDFIQHLDGDGPKIGSNMLLKVMAGDKFNLRVNSWWKSTASPDAPNSPLNDIITALNAAIPGLSGGKVTSGQLSGGNTISPGASAFLDRIPGYDAGKPKAFVNWILFDEQFNYVSEGSGFDQVHASENFDPHIKDGVNVPKNGYLYIYVSNETPNIDVYFDNLQVTHIRGALLEETHYYPYGLTMAGISTKAFTPTVSSSNCGCPNKIGYNGNELQASEFTDKTGLELYDFNARSYDQQIGRFMQVDPLTDKGEQEKLSVYHFSYNNPVRYNDPDGKCPRCPWIYRAIAAYKSLPKVSVTTSGRVNATGTYTVTDRSTGKAVTLTETRPLITEFTVTVKYKGTHDGLQIVQFVNGNALPGGKLPSGLAVQQMYVGGQLRTAFTDGGKNSPAGEQVSGKPYYNSADDLKDVNYANSTRTVYTIGNEKYTVESITLKDIPTAAASFNELKFETNFIIMNPNGNKGQETAYRLGWGTTKDSTGKLVAIPPTHQSQPGGNSAAGAAISRNDGY